MKAQIENILISKEINPTPNRMLVLNYMLYQQAATSLTDIERELIPMDRVSVYRTLKTFQEKGLVHSIEDGTGVPKYAMCAEECDAQRHRDLHLHFYCRSCKETFCLPATKIPKVKLPVRFRADEVDLIIKGLCNKCNTIA
ncbi:MAG TPA: transcriptional repressor [Sphingobacteriaceae bacterium]